MPQANNIVCGIVFIKGHKFDIVPHSINWYNLLIDNISLERYYA